MPNELFILFYGGPFSNWHYCNFTDKYGNKFNHNEKYMMWRKAKLFGDENTMELILRADTPNMCKRLGRLVQGFNEEVWIHNREQIVYEGAYLKFTQNKYLLDIILNIDMRASFVEASPKDCIWGAGLSKYHPDIRNRNKWPGLNLLGKMYDRLRDELSRL